MAQTVGVSPSTPLDESSFSVERSLCACTPLCIISCLHEFPCVCSFVLFFRDALLACVSSACACVSVCASWQRWVRCQGPKWRFDIGTVGRRVEKRAGTQTTRATGMEKRGEEWGEGDLGDGGNGVKLQEGHYVSESSSRKSVKRYGKAIRWGAMSRRGLFPSATSCSTSPTQNAFPHLHLASTHKCVRFHNTSSGFTSTSHSLTQLHFF